MYQRFACVCGCDEVAHLRKGDQGLVEIKIGGDKLIEHGTETLKTLKNKIDTTGMEGPRFLMVLTGVVQYVCCRTDGLYVVTIGCLRE